MCINNASDGGDNGESSNEPLELFPDGKWMRVISHEDKFSKAG